MIKPLNLRESDVIAFLSGQHGQLEKIMETVTSAALEGADTTRAKLNEADSKAVLCAIESVEARIKVARMLATEAPNWLITVMKEDRTAWVKEFKKGIEEAETLPKILRIIDDIDKKIEECKDTIDDQMTLTSFTRKAIYAGLIVGTAVLNPIAGAGTAAATVINEGNINKSKSLIRSTMNELMNLRRMAEAKRGKLRKETSASSKSSSDDSNDDDNDDYGEESGIASSFKIAKDLISRG
jgi:hypothetical protein